MRQFVLSPRSVRPAPPSALSLCVCVVRLSVSCAPRSLQGSSISLASLSDPTRSAPQRPTPAHPTAADTNMPSGICSCCRKNHILTKDGCKKCGGSMCNFCRHANGQCDMCHVKTCKNK